MILGLLLGSLSLPLCSLCLPMPPQIEPKSPPDRHQSASSRHLWTHWRPRGTPDLPKVDFWVLFGSLLAPFWSLVGPLLPKNVIKGPPLTLQTSTRLTLQTSTWLTLPIPSTNPNPTNPTHLNPAARHSLAGKFGRPSCRQPYQHFTHLMHTIFQAPCGMWLATWDIYIYIYHGGA